MSCNVKLKNSGQCFNVKPGENILDAARRQNITLPYGRNNGVCGACLYRIIEGDVRYPDGQPLALLEYDIESGKGLCCAGHPASDIESEPEYPGEDLEPWV
jgi:ferredoxin